MGAALKELAFEGKQLTAIQYLLDPKKRLVAVTGPAGTGKTSLIKEAHRILAQHHNVAIAAPTGKAARRVTEATGIPAVTVHRLLGFGKPLVDQETGKPTTTTRPYYHNERRLPYDVILIDEYAMVNESLHRDIMDAIPHGGKLGVFGDIEQLPPIEEYELKTNDGTVYRSPFERLLELPSSVVLDTIYRQAGDSGIIQNANLIKSGKSPVRRNDFKLTITDTPLKSLRDILASDEVDFSTLTNQVLTATNKTDLGTHKLNQIMQSHYKPYAHEGISVPRYKYDEKYPINITIGDKIICTENSYDMRDFFARYGRTLSNGEPDYDSFITCPETFYMLNGEIGLVEEIDNSGGLLINFGDRYVSVPPSYRDIHRRYKQMVSYDPRKRLQLAYATTVHKAQGSEFDTVCFFMHRVCSWAINRNLLYTAVTRAKSLVHLVTDTGQYQTAARYNYKEKEAFRNMRSKK